LIRLQVFWFSDFFWDHLIPEFVVVHIRGIKHPDLQANALRQWLRKYWFPYIIIAWFVANVILNFQRSKCFLGRDSFSQVQEWCQYGPSVYSYFGCVNYAFERWWMRHLYSPIQLGRHCRT
jgi:hypothetical protein